MGVCKKNDYLSESEISAAKHENNLYRLYDGELTQQASDMKKIAKQSKGSCFRTDKRQTK
jgi:hypothetical protein